MWSEAELILERRAKLAGKLLEFWNHSILLHWRFVLTFHAFHWLSRLCQIWITYSKLQQKTRAWSRWKRRCAAMCRRFSDTSSSASYIAVTLINPCFIDFYFNEQEKMTATKVILDFLCTVQEPATSNVSAPAAALSTDIVESKPGNS